MVRLSGSPRPDTGNVGLDRARRLAAGSDPEGSDPHAICISAAATMRSSPTSTL